MTGEPQRWIVVPNWFGQDDPSEGLQHYKDREPKWIKNYRRLLYKDEYRDLSGHCRAILHGLWLEYASTDGRLRADSSSLSSRLALRVTKLQLESLNHAGFIHFSASKPLALSEQRAIPEEETETEVETQDLQDQELGLPYNNGRTDANGRQNGLTTISEQILQSLEEAKPT